MHAGTAPVEVTREPNALHIRMPENDVVISIERDVEGACKSRAMVVVAVTLMLMVALVHTRAGGSCRGLQALQGPPFVAWRSLQLDDVRTC